MAKNHRLLQGTPPPKRKPSKAAKVKLQRQVGNKVGKAFAPKKKFLGLF